MRGTATSFSSKRGKVCLLWYKNSGKTNVGSLLILFLIHFNKQWHKNQQVKATNFLSCDNYFAYSLMTFRSDLSTCRMVALSSKTVVLISGTGGLTGCRGGNSDGNSAIFNADRIPSAPTIT